MANATKWEWFLDNTPQQMMRILLRTLRINFNLYKYCENYYVVLTSVSNMTMSEYQNDN